MDSIIKVQGVGKKYMISHEGAERYKSLRDVIARGAKGKFKATDTSKEAFWALKDLDFEINKGDAVGIIGRNGAGKSTLLKILSRITEPSVGRIEITGRIASLLEVGTGFHPELTGRENIFLNGAILGMSRKEIRDKFDEIVDFSGVEKFLDTQVKRYSSGMYVRLAFSVAAHLEPEILVVDEVLAVGDAEFQKKCLGKMKEVSTGEGRTVLFVSHSLGSVAQLCTKGILLNGGQLQYQGAINETISNYLNLRKSATNLFVRTKQEKAIYTSEMYTMNGAGEQADEFMHNEDVLVKIGIAGNDESKSKYRILITVLDSMKRKVSSAETLTTSDTLTLKIKAGFFARGSFSISAICYIPGVMPFDIVDDQCAFSVIDGGSEFAHLETFDYGVVFSKSEWI